MYTNPRERPFAPRYDAPTPCWRRLRLFLSWSFMERDPVVTDAVDAAQAQLRQITAELEGIRFRLLGVHASLAATFAQEGLTPPGPGHPGTSAEIVSAVECVLIDRIGPALRSLQEAVQEEKSPAPGGKEDR